MKAVLQAPATLRRTAEQHCRSTLPSVRSVKHLTHRLVTILYPAWSVSSDKTTAADDRNVMHTRPVRQTLQHAVQHAYCTFATSLRSRPPRTRSIQARLALTAPKASEMAQFPSLPFGHAREHWTVPSLHPICCTSASRGSIAIRKEMSPND